MVTSPLRLSKIVLPLNTNMTEPEVDLYDIRVALNHFSQEQQKYSSKHQTSTSEANHI